MSLSQPLAAGPAFVLLHGGRVEVVEVLDGGDDWVMGLVGALTHQRLRLWAPLHLYILPCLQTVNLCSFRFDSGGYLAYPWIGSG